MQPPIVIGIYQYTIMSEYKFFVTPQASNKIQEQLQKRGTPNIYLRVGLQGGGCSGYKYIIMFDDGPPKSKDLLFELEGVKLLVDKKSIIYLNGCTLDWEKSLLNQGFKFLNPNEKSRCGCGTSFDV